MRILRFLFTALLVLFVVSGLGFFVIREGLLIGSVAKVRTSMQTMRRISNNAGTYIEECRKKGIFDDGASIATIQLRFITDNEYVVEVICNHFSLSPIEVERQKLLPFVSKEKGQSGIVWGYDPSGVTVSVFGRRRNILVDNLDIVYADELESVVNPQTVCAGYGYECCQEVTTVGEGALINSATDCPRSCFSMCTPRPVVLTFNSQPFFNSSTNTLEVTSGEQVLFGYVVESPTESATVNLDFGDGTSEKSDKLIGQMSHQYTCSQGVCRYKASLVATDTKGKSSVTLPNTVITVVVTQ